MVDGASTDSTIDIINQHIKQHANQITSFITEPDKDNYDALNVSIRPVPYCNLFRLMQFQFRFPLERTSQASRSKAVVH
jgi:glycosyltransferase involved in cell wall biosynthesis